MPSGARAYAFREADLVDLFSALQTDTYVTERPTCALYYSTVWSHTVPLVNQAALDAHRVTTE